MTFEIDSSQGTVAQQVAKLAVERGVAPTATGLDAWCDAVSRSAGDEVTLDETGRLLARLVTTRVLTAVQASRLLAKHLDERRPS